MRPIKDSSINNIINYLKKCDDSVSRGNIGKTANVDYYTTLDILNDLLNKELITEKLIKVKKTKRNKAGIRKYYKWKR